MKQSEAFKKLNDTATQHRKSIEKVIPTVRKASEAFQEFGKVYTKLKRSRE